MKKVSYYEDWSITNPNEFDYDAIDKKLGVSAKSNTNSGGCNSLPNNFDCSMFDDDQLEYLAEYLPWYRKEVSQHLLRFLNEPAKSIKKNSERSRKAINMRMLCRLVLLHKIINDDETGYRDLPETFGISNHILYDERKRIIDELINTDKNIEFIICNNRHLK